MNIPLVNRRLVLPWQELAAQTNAFATVTAQKGRRRSVDSAMMLNEVGASMLALRIPALRECI